MSEQQVFQQIQEGQQMTAMFHSDQKSAGLPESAGVFFPKQEPPLQDLAPLPLRTSKTPTSPLLLPIRNPAKFPPL